MSKRETALALMRIAGYHDDKRLQIRLLVESRVNRQAMNESFLNGRQARLNGVRCNCYECKQANQPTTR